MRLAKYRFVPAPEAQTHAAPRLAGGEDAFVASPVHQLQSGLAVFEDASDAPADDRFPGWFRLGFPLVTSAMLWAAILWGARLLG